MFKISNGFTRMWKHKNINLNFHPCRKLSVKPYSIVKPGIIHPLRSVPDGITRPEYIKTSFLSKIAHNVFLKTKKLDIKSSEDIERMKDACRIARLVLNVVGESICPGVTTDELDRVAHNECIAYSAYPSPLLYKGFPKSICTSVNNVACHGIPDNRSLCDGDIVNVDVTVFYRGFHGDVSETFLVGDVDEGGRHLVTVARRCRDEAIQACGPNKRLSIIGETISAVAEEEGCHVIADFCGHGIGTYFHGPPDIIHVRNNFKGTMLEGMTFTIEPVISEGSMEFDVLDDGWTAVTKDDSRTAQFEHTILITKNGPVILTE